MNAITNETQLRFCDICDKTIKVPSKSKNINSKTRKHKQKLALLLKNMNLLNQILMK